MNRKNSILMSLGISAVLIAIGSWYLYQCPSGFGPGRWIMSHHMMRGGGMGMIMMFFWMTVMVLIISRIMTHRTPSEETDHPSDSNPMKILKLRYAKGEIDKDQFNAMQRDLL